MKIECEIWDMKNGMITSVKIGEQIYNQDGQNVIQNSFPIRKHKRYCNIIDTWIKKNHISEFGFEQFAKDNPGVKRNRFNHFISLMIQDNTVTQLGNDKFKVVKG